jgi:hypothetical protein
MPKLIKLRLTLDLDIDPQGETQEYLEGQLHRVVKDAASNGTFTGDGPATVELYNFKVTKRRK